MTTATASPTYRTRSTASSGSDHAPPSGMGAPSATSAPSSGGGGGVRSSMSWTVSTATTPGASRAAEVSMPVIRACATGLRTNVTRAASVSSGTLRSST